MLFRSLGVGDVGNIVLRDRHILAEEGIIIVVLTLDGGSGQVLAGPDIVSRGFVYVRDAGDLMDDAQSVLNETMNHLMDKFINCWSNYRRDNWLTYRGTYFICPWSPVNC